MTVAALIRRAWKTTTTSCELIGALLGFLTTGLLSDSGFCSKPVPSIGSAAILLSVAVTLDVQTRKRPSTVSWRTPGSRTSPLPQGIGVEKEQIHRQPKKKAPPTPLGTYEYGLAQASSDSGLPSLPATDYPRIVPAEEFAKRTIWDFLPFSAAPEDWRACPEQGLQERMRETQEASEFLLHLRRPPRTAKTTMLPRPRFSANLIKPIPISAAPPTLLDVASSNCVASSRHFLHTCHFLSLRTRETVPHCATISSLCMAVAAERNARAALCKQQAASSCLAAWHPSTRRGNRKA